MYYRWKLRVLTSMLEAGTFWAVPTSGFYCPLKVRSYAAGNKSGVETTLVQNMARGSEPVLGVKTELEAAAAYSYA